MMCKSGNQIVSEVSIVTRIEEGLIRVRKNESKLLWDFHSRAYEDVLELQKEISMYKVSERHFSYMNLFDWSFCNNIRINDQENIIVNYIKEIMNISYNIAIQRLKLCTKRFITSNNWFEYPPVEIPHIGASFVISRSTSLHFSESLSITIFFDML